MSWGVWRRPLTRYHFPLSNDTIAYQAIQRTLRNCVVDALRQRLSPAMQDPNQQIRGLFREEDWESARDAARLAREAGYVRRHPRDVFDELDVSQFHNVVEKYFTDMFPVSELPDSYRRKEKQAVLGWIRDIVGVRHPMSHPLQDDMPAADLMRVLDSCRRLADRFACEEASNELDSLYTSVISHTISLEGGRHPSVQVQLPPRESVVVDFIGRERELATLWRWLLDPLSRRWLLSGDGGKGKSSTAYQFAANVASQPPRSIDGILWISAKLRRFEEGESVDIDDPDFWDLDSAFDQLLLFYGEREATSFPTEAKRELALVRLNELPMMLIVDDLDSIPEESDEVIDFFTTDVAQTQSKILVTSRRPFPGYGRAKTSIGGFNLDETRDFLQSRIRLLELPIADFAERQADEVHNLCEGSPLYIEDLLRLAKSDGLRRAMQLWRDHRGDEARSYALRREMEMLTSDAREVLHVLSLSKSPLSVLEVAHVLGWTERKITDGIRELERMYLVPSAELVEDVPRFQLHPNLSALVKREFAETERAHELRTAIAGVTGGDPMAGLRREVREYLSQAHAAFARGDRELAERTLRAGLEECPNQPALYEKLAWISKVGNPRRAVDARKYWKRAYELGATEESMYREWLMMEIDEQEWLKAAEVAERWLTRVDSNSPQALQLGGYARSRLGQDYKRRAPDAALEQLRMADGMLARALNLKGGKGRHVDRSRANRAYVVNAQSLAELGAEKPETVRVRSRTWLDKMPDDPRALDNARRIGISK